MPFCLDGCAAAFFPSIQFLCREAKLPQQSENRPHVQAENIEIMRRLRTETETPTRERSRKRAQRQKKIDQSWLQQSTSLFSSLSLFKDAPCLSRSSSAAGPPAAAIAVEGERCPSPGGVRDGRDEETAEKKGRDEERRVFFSPLSPSAASASTRGEERKRKKKWQPSSTT